MIIKDGVFYLICAFRDYDDIRQLALHRIQSAEVLHSPSIELNNFDLDEYISSGAMGISIGEDIRLKALFSNGAVKHLHERPLSRDQQINTYDEDWHVVEATVQNNNELRWWLLGFGEHAKVQAPNSLKDEMKQRIVSMLNNYEG